MDLLPSRFRDPVPPRTKPNRRTARSRLNMKRYPVLFVLLAALALGAPETATRLAAPQKAGGMPLMEALARRATARAFDTRDLPDQELSNLLWAAFGVNRPNGRRTAPSAHDARETVIYVLLPRGTFRYDAVANRLDEISREDNRALGGMQAFVKDAPVTLVYVADLDRLGRGSVADRKLTAYIDVGFVAANASLYCASAGFATGVRMMIDHAALASKLKLRASEIIVLAQSVGYPKPGDGGER